MKKSSNHESINTSNIKRLTIRDGALFWDGNKIKAEVGLSKTQEKIAVTAAVVTIVTLILSGFHTSVQIYDRFHEKDPIVDLSLKVRG